MARGVRNAVASSSDFEAKTLVPEMAGGDLDGGDIEVVQERDFEHAAKEAKFMEEKVLVEIEPDDRPNAPTFIYLGHNGIGQYVHRGHEQAVKRKFLYSALAAKAVKVVVEFGKDNSNNEFNRQTGTAATTHRIRLLQDNNPQGGQAWVRRVMQDPALHSM